MGEAAKKQDRTTDARLRAEHKTKDTFDEIAERLNAEGLRTTTGKKWTRFSLQGQFDRMGLRRRRSFKRKKKSAIAEAALEHGRKVGGDRVKRARNVLKAGGLTAEERIEIALILLGEK